jgi:mono/diheme cytochrome c family protein
MIRTRILIAILCGGAAVVSAQRGPDAARGKQLYLSGSDSVTASVGGQSLPSAVLPCANCHGIDGRGRAEGGVVPSNVTWLELTKPYRASTPNGRRRPAYDEQTFARAVTRGIDSAGNALNPAMPHYAMSPEQLADLIAYLKVLGREEVPGVTDTSVRIGTIVPASGAGDQMAAVLSAFFKEAGEIHGRRVTVDVVRPSEVARAQPFAFVGGLISGVDEQVEQAVDRAGIPLVLPVSVRADASALNRFYLSPGLQQQLRGLLQFAGAKKISVVGNRELAAGLDVDIDDRADTVVVLDPSANVADVRPDAKLLLLGNLLPDDFFRSRRQNVLVALTTTPGDLTSGGLAEYRAFAARHSIPHTNIAAQLSAYTAAKVFVHALKLNGRELTRESLRASLESLYEFETGITPPLTFGRGRRVGAPRVHVATLDPTTGTLVPVGTFTTND